MNDAEKSARPVSRESTRAIREDVKKHVRLEAELASCLQAALAAQRLDEKALARVLEARCSATREGMALIFRWLDQIDRRIGQAEAHLSDVIKRASDHDEALRIVCALLKEIDDPYGFGESLDERIFGEAAHGPADEAD